MSKQDKKPTDKKGSLKIKGTLDSVLSVSVPKPKEKDKDNK
ncbi:hypothetical protein [uncultured Winogradskyella sp.]|nr:hypothetical protein [uncultured Winogradskyella sp.]